MPGLSHEPVAPPRVLVIDDDANIRLVVAGVLRQEGYTVDEAANGQDGLARVRRTRPDLVVLDLIMPKLDGAGFAKALKASGEQPDIPIILLSAATHLQTVAQELQPYGVRAVLTKPFDVEALLGLVSYFAPTGPAERIA